MAVFRVERNRGYPLFLHRITLVERQKKQVHGSVFSHAPASFGY